MNKDKIIQLKDNNGNNVSPVVAYEAVIDKDGKNITTKIDELLKDYELSNYYDKDEVNTLVDKVEDRFDEVYSKNQMDRILEDYTLDADKLDVYTKDEVNQKIEDVIGTSPDTLDTLQELANALGNDENFAATVTTQIGLKANISDVYSKAQSDGTFAYKSQVYNKSDIDEAFAKRDSAINTKANAEDVYGKDEVDDKVEEAKTYTYNKSEENKRYIDDKINDLIDGAPGLLDTLQELSNALGDDPNFATTITNQIATVNAKVTTVDTNLANHQTWTAGRINELEAAKANSADVYDKTSVNNLLSTNVINLNVITNQDAVYEKGKSTLNYGQWSGTDNNPTDDWYSHIVMNHANSNGYFTEIASCFHDDRLYTRKSVGGTPSEWVELLTTNNAYDKDIIDGRFNSNDYRVFSIEQRFSNYVLKGIYESEKVDLIDSIDTKADKSNTYIKSEVDTLLSQKATVGTSYTKLESDGRYAFKVDSYTKDEVDTKISALVDSAPGTLDTLNELANALGDNPNFATDVTTLIGSKANKVDVYTKTEVDSEIDGLGNSVSRAIDNVNSQLSDRVTLSQYNNEVVNDLIPSVEALKDDKADVSYVDTNFNEFEEMLESQYYQRSDVDSKLAMLENAIDAIPTGGAKVTNGTSSAPIPNLSPGDRVILKFSGYGSYFYKEVGFGSPSITSEFVITAVGNRATLSIYIRPNYTVSVSNLPSGVTYAGWTVVKF